MQISNNDYAISARKSAAVAKRATDLGITQHIRQGIHDGRRALH